MTVMIARLFLVIGVFVLGSEAASFTSRSDLKTAVDSCLVNDPPAECDDMPSWNVSLVTDMSEMFDGASTFNADISGWNTSSVTNMYGMFLDASAFNADISGWDTSSVTDMEGMFEDASAWLASYVRVDGSSSVDGPPSAWARSSPLPASPTPAPQPSPPPSLVFEDYSSGANRVAPLAFAASVVVVAAFAGDSPF
jgi:surface protein